jgi:hypothetical protein
MIDQDGDGRVTEGDLKVMLSNLGEWGDVIVNHVAERRLLIDGNLDLHRPFSTHWSVLALASPRLHYTWSCIVLVLVDLGHALPLLLLPPCPSLHVFSPCSACSACSA